MAVVPGWVYVVCPHRSHARFVRNAQGEWKGLDSSGEQVEGAWRFPLRCDLCRLNVPIRHMNLIGPVLDRLVVTDNPVIGRDAMNAAIVPLKLLADAVGASQTLPE